MANHSQPVLIDEEKRNFSTTSIEKDHGLDTALDAIDRSAERAYGIVFQQPSCRKI